MIVSAACLHGRAASRRGLYMAGDQVDNARMWLRLHALYRPRHVVEGRSRHEPLPDPRLKDVTNNLFEDISSGNPRAVAFVKPEKVAHITQRGCCLPPSFISFTSSIFCAVSATLGDFAIYIPRSEKGAIIKLTRLSITRQKPCGGPPADSHCLMRGIF
jgi:hypothetical protein